MVEGWNVEGPPLKHALGMGARAFRVGNEAASAQAKQPVVATGQPWRGARQRGSEGVAWMMGYGFLGVLRRKVSRPVPCKKHSAVQ